jgi:hypothetical protein
MSRAILTLFKKKNKPERQAVASQGIATFT